MIIYGVTYHRQISGFRRLLCVLIPDDDDDDGDDDNDYYALQKDPLKILDINMTPLLPLSPLTSTLYIRVWAIYIHIYYIPMYSEIIWANPCFVKSSDLFCFKVKKKKKTLQTHPRGLPAAFSSSIACYFSNWFKKNNSVNVLFGMRIVIYPFYYYSYGYYYYYY